MVSAMADNLSDFERPADNRRVLTHDSRTDMNLLAVRCRKVVKQFGKGNTAVFALRGVNFRPQSSNSGNDDWAGPTKTSAKAAQKSRKNRAKVVHDRGSAVSRERARPFKGRRF